MRWLVVAIGAAPVLGAPAARAGGDAGVGATVAARPARLEVGGFVAAAFLPGDVELGNSWAPDQVPGSGPAVGGRATWWLVPRWLHGDGLALDLGVEGELAVIMSSTSSDAAAGRRSYAAPILGVGAHLVAALRTDTPVSPHLVVGGGANTVFTGSPYAHDDLDPVFYWGLGASWQVGDRTAVRVDLRHGVEAGRMNDLTSTFTAEVGLTRTFGARAGTAWRPSSIAERGHAGDEPHVTVAPPPPPPADTDDDGITDDKDRCPNAAEDIDGFQDADGCPDPDNDGDGLDDHVDQCPDRAETVNGYQDDDGCPDEVPAALAAIQGPPHGVEFGRGSARISRTARHALYKIARTLRRYPGVRLRVEGHAGKGTDDDLARRRATSVKWCLIDGGIAADRIDEVAVPADAGAARIELHLAPARPPPAPPAAAPAPPAASPGRPSPTPAP